MPNVSGSACAARGEGGGAHDKASFNHHPHDAPVRGVVRARPASERAARLKLDALVDPSPNSTTSLRNTLNGDLGDSVGFAQVATASEYRNYPIGAAPNIVEYLGCEFTVVIGT
jgi:hypothetical protein